jgi:hypothetical protein
MDTIFLPGTALKPFIPSTPPQPLRISHDR